MLSRSLRAMTDFGSRGRYSRFSILVSGAADKVIGVPPWPWQGMCILPISIFYALRTFVAPRLFYFLGHVRSIDALGFRHPVFSRIAFVAKGDVVQRGATASKADAGV